MKKIFFITLLCSNFIFSSWAELVPTDSLKTKNIDCIVQDTIKLTVKAKRRNGKMYYYTDRECTVVELKTIQKEYPFKFLIEVIRKIMKYL